MNFQSFDRVLIPSAETGVIWSGLLEKSIHKQKVANLPRLKKF
jgi:hypothetical protein